MAQITGLPNGRNINLGMGTGNVGVPRVTPDDFGADDWRNWQRLGQAVTQAGVARMQQWITNDHQRQEDEAKEDWVGYNAHQAGRMNELMEKKGSEAFDGSLNYLNNDPGWVPNAPRKGGKIYERMLAEHKLRTDNQNIQELNKYAVAERSRLRLEAASAVNGQAMERIQKFPGSLDLELNNTILPNVRTQLDEQGITDETTRKFYESQAVVGATKNALTSLAAEYGAEQALKMLSSEDAFRLKDRVGAATWNKIFDVERLRLRSQAAREENKAAQNQMAKEMALLYDNGTELTEIRDIMLEKYGTLGAPAVYSMLNQTAALPSKADKDTSKQEVSNFERLLLQGQTSDNQLEWLAAQKSPTALKSYIQAKKNINEQQDAVSDFKVRELTIGNSSLATDISRGNYFEAETALLSLQKAGEVNGAEYQKISKFINDARGAHADTVYGEDVPLTRETTSLTMRDNLRKARAANQSLIKFGQMMQDETAPPEETKIYQDASLEEREFFDKQLARVRAKSSNYVADENLMQANYYKWDSLASSDPDTFASIMAQEEGQAAVFASMGGPNTTQSKDIWKRFQNPDTKMAYTTSAVKEVGDRLKGVYGFTAQEYTAIKPTVDNLITEGFNEYQLDNKLASPALVPPKVRASIISGAIYEAINNREGLVTSGSGTTVEYSEVERIYPEIAETTIRYNEAGVNPMERVFTGKEAPVTWAFRVNQETGARAWVQENIPYYNGVRGMDPRSMEALTNISIDANNFPYGVAGRLDWYPTFKEFTLHNNRGEVIARYNEQGRRL